MNDRQTTGNRTVSPESNISVESAAISDRGLSEKRPVNEDSFLADAERRIFAVADGVGGAESGEVASQTAVETLDEAFRHHKSGDDAEDLMEIAFQRANLAIHQMSREHSKLAMMATTVVALHLDSTRATFGHVGDSRLYRLSADGELKRETADHSVVEEEVRAGRMTADEAQHHPSRNVISRALGAEATVEAEMRTVVINPGTLFLLCSDGITRHVSDDELRELLTTESNLHRICEELKRRCYERGAEDNLTAVIVRVGAKGTQHSYETTRLSEQTLPLARPATAYATGELSQAFADFNTTQQPAETTQQKSNPVARTNSLSPLDAAKPPASTRFEIPTGGASTETDPETRHEDSPAAALHAGETHARRKHSRIKLLLFPILFLVLTATALAFYFYRNGNVSLTSNPQAEPLNGSMTPISPSPAAPTPVDVPLTHAPSYIEQREAVDEAPQIMMQQMWSERNGAPLEATDPRFLYLYGRALYRMGSDREAHAAFRRSLEMLRQQQSARDAMAIDGAYLNGVEAQLRAADTPSLGRASEMLDQAIERMSVSATQTQPPF